MKICYEEPVGFLEELEVFKVFKMNYRLVFGNLGYIIFFIGLFMLCPLSVNFYYDKSIKEFVIPQVLSNTKTISIT